MERQIFDSIDEVDSFDAFYAKVHLGRTTLVIPYINLGVSRHPLNPASHLKFIDFAYLVCLGVQYLKVQKGILIGRREDTGSLLHFGGFPMDESPDFVDFEIGCESAYLQLLPNSLLSDTCLIPVESPKQNLDNATVEAFFRGDRMPESIRRLVNGRS